MHMMGIEDDPVRRGIAVSLAIDRFIAGDSERTGVRRQGAVVRDLVVDGLINQFVIWRPKNGFIN